MIIERAPFLHSSKQKIFLLYQQKIFSKKKNSFDPVQVLFRVTFNLNSISQGKRPKRSENKFGKK
jgi:hypothetical protein